MKRAKPRGGQTQTQNREQHSPEIDGSDSGHVSTKKIFIGGLSASLTKEEFWSYFERYGRITDVVVIR